MENKAEKIPTEIRSLVRHLIQGVSVALIAADILPSGSAEVLLGLFGVVGPYIWSVIEKRANAKTIEALVEVAEQIRKEKAGS